MNTGDKITAENASWTFGGDVSKKFEDHVSKSVPLYNEGHDLVAKLSDFFLADGSRCYELGSSTAKLTRTIAKRHEKKNIDFQAIDREEGMSEEARKHCAPFKNIQVVTADLTEFEFDKADFIISYYTMQFVKPKFRQMLFDRIYASLNWGGAFVLFEKVRAPDARFQDMMSAIYTDYKLDRGYGPDEIVAKSRSLKGVLEPFSTQGNLDLITRAGFKDVMSVMKYVSFEGFVAIK